MKPTQRRQLCPFHLRLQIPSSWARSAVYSLFFDAEPLLHHVRPMGSLLETRTWKSSCARSRGLESYTLTRSSEGGGMSMTVCRDKAGTEESVRVAKDWIAKNSANISLDDDRQLGSTKLAGTSASGQSRRFGKVRRE